MTWNMNDGGISAPWPNAPSSTRVSEAHELLLLFEDAKRSGAVVQVGQIDSWHDRRHETTWQDWTWPDRAWVSRWPAASWSGMATPATLPNSPAYTCSRLASLGSFSQTASAQRSPPALQLGGRIQRESVSKISDEAAVCIFLAGRHASRDGLSARLAGEYGISTKAVRDIWNLRTWRHVTKPHWAPRDMQRFQSKPRPLTPKPHKPAGGEARIEIAEWAIDPAIIAAEFHEIFMEWETSAIRQQCRM